MPRGLAVGSNEPVQIWDGGQWDFAEGEDFEPGEWRLLAIELKAIAVMLGGTGHATEIVHRDKKCNIMGKTFRWQFIRWRTGWRGGL
jgi:hypothetical protein